MKKTCRLLALLLAVLLFSGCGESNLEIVQDSREKSVIMVTKAMNSLHWLSVKEGAEDAARDYDLRLQVLWPENESDADAQNQILQDCIDSNCDGVIWAPCNSNRVQKYAATLSCRGKALMYMDEEPGNIREAPFIGVDNWHAGELAAECLADALLPGSKVAVIGGSMEQKAHDNRINGFKTYIMNHTKLEFTEIKEVPDATLAGGKRAMEELIKEQPEIKGVFCSSAMMVLGAQAACRNRYRQEILLVGMDTQRDAMSALAEGKLHAMISQNAYTIGYMAVKRMAAMLNGEELESIYYIDTDLVTKELADQYMNEYDMEGRQ